MTTNKLHITRMPLSCIIAISPLGLCLGLGFVQSFGGIAAFKIGVSALRISPRLQSDLRRLKLREV